MKHSRGKRAQLVSEFGSVFFDLAKIGLPALNLNILFLPFGREILQRFRRRLFNYLFYCLVVGHHSRFYPVRDARFQCAAPVGSAVMGFADPFRSRGMAVSALGGPRPRTRPCLNGPVGFAVWIDARNTLAWAQGTHEYRPLGTAVIAQTDQFRHRDFLQNRRRPQHLESSFAGFFGSLEEVNAHLRSRSRWKLRCTPGHLL